jgi:hypothetical protein
VDYSNDENETDRLRRRVAQWRAFAVLMFFAFAGTMLWLYFAIPGGVKLSHFTWILPR